MKFSLSVRFAVLCLLSVLAGCATLPDMKEFSSQTSTMASAVNMGKEETVKLMSSAQDAESSLADMAKNLDTSWNATSAALEAVVEYSGSLAAVVDAGNKGAESAKKVVDAVNGVVSAIHAIPKLEIATNTASFLFGQAIKLKALHNLEEAVTAADPKMQAIADIITSNLVRVQGIYGDVCVELKGQEGASLRADYKKFSNSIEGMQFEIMQKLDILGRRDILLKQAEEIKSSSLDKARKLPGYARCKGDADDTPSVAECARRLAQNATKLEEELADLDLDMTSPEKIARRKPQLMQELQASSAFMAMCQAQAKEHDEKKAALEATCRNGRALLDKAAKAMAKWAKAHAEIGPAIREGRSFSLAGFILAVKDLSAAYAKIAGGDK